jgi:hypothetical protein
MTAGNSRVGSILLYDRTARRVGVVLLHPDGIDHDPEITHRNRPTAHPCWHAIVLDWAGHTAKEGGMNINPSHTKSSSDSIRSTSCPSIA